MTKKCFYRLGIGFGMAMIVGVAVSWFVAGALVASHPAIVGSPPADLEAIEFAIDSESGAKISGWKVPATPCRGVVVLAHGIGASRLAMVPRARMLRRLGFATVLIDLQAHGESSGERVTLGHLEREDVRAAVSLARQSYPGVPVGVIGVSLGGAAAILGSPLGVDALVVESVYSTIEAAVSNRVTGVIGPLAPIPTKILLWQLEPRTGISPSQLRPLDAIQNAECPVMIVSGAEDWHTTAEETKQFYKAAADPKEIWIVAGAAHVDLHAVDPAKYEQRVGAFLKKYCRD